MIGLIRAGDLDRWAARISAAPEFPRLIRLLVHATAGGLTQADFPADEAVRLAGWDGRVLAGDASRFVPAGFSAWELGTGQDPREKANDDYQKRSRDTLGLDPRQTTFVFVTPRQWPRREEWIAERRADRFWKDVIAFDAESLAQWLEVAPAVAAWLAPLIGSVSPDARALQEVCAEYRAATRPSLSLAGLLIGREAERQKLLTFLEGPPSAIEVSAITAAEAQVFVGACLESLPEQQAESLWARAIAADATTDLRVLGVSSRPLLVVTSGVPNVGTIQHHVVKTAASGGAADGSIELRAQPVSALVEFLATQGLDRNDAYERCQDASGYLERVRHTLFAIAPAAPVWAAPSVSVSVAAAILIGAWDETSAADREVVTRISRVEYEEFVRAITPFQGGASPLVSRVGTVWKVYGRAMAWKQLESALTTQQFEAFLRQAVDVLLEPDPRFDLAPEERWTAQVHGKSRAHSGALREGLANGLVCAAVLGRDSSSCYAGRRAQTWVDSAVKQLFEKRGDPGFWRRVRGELQELAEASPDVFLSALEGETAQARPQVRDLFEEEGDFGSCLHCDLLWALESLAWAPNYLGRAALILAALSEMDPGGKMSNRPGRSLAEMLLPSLPQSNSTASERKDVLRLIVRRYPKAGWELAKALMPSGTTVVTPGAKPRLRDWGAGSEGKPVLIADYWAEIQDIAELMLGLAGTDVARWHFLVSNLNALLPELKERVLSAAEEFGATVDGEQRLELWNRLRKLLHHHNQFSARDNISWVYSREVLERLERLYAALAPKDPVDRVAWLFRVPVERPVDVASDWHQEEENVRAERAAAAEILSRFEIDKLLVALERFDDPHALGYHLGSGSQARVIEQSLLRRCAGSAVDHERRLVRGFSAARHQASPEEFPQRWCSRAGEEFISERAAATILLGLPAAPTIWDAVEAAGKTCWEAFWKETSLHIFDRPRDAERAARNFLGVGRALSAIDLLAANTKPDWLAGDGDVHLIVDALVAGVEEANADPVAAQHIAHDVAHLLKVVFDCGRLDERELMHLEWMYFGVLEHQAEHELVIFRRLMEDQELLLQLIGLTYVPEGEKREGRPEPSERERAAAAQAWRILHEWKPFASAQASAMPSADELGAIVTELRRLAAERHHTGIVDDYLGKALASSPVGSDGVWPHEAVRDALERFGSEALDDGFVSGKCNLRGVTTRLPGDGGAQERGLATEYEQWQRALAMTHPHVSTLLGRLSDVYRSDANQQDVGRFLLR